MSYILDALRKSEEARRRQQGPDLSLADAAPDAERQRPSKALPLLALALLVNGAVLGIWLLRSGTSEATPTAAESTAGIELDRATATRPPAPAAAATPQPATTATTATTSTTAPANEVARAPVLDPAADTSGFDWRRQPIIRIDDLTPLSRSRLPKLAISTHIYADEPGYREVSINGRRYQEGDRVAGLPLLEITETGVLMGFEEQVIRLDLQDEWDL